MRQSVEGLIQRLHHITLVTSNQEINRRFYTEIMGLRRVKLSVNQDDIYHRHLFYADEKGTAGGTITFFEWPGLPLGEVGLGSPHHLAYTVAKLEALPRWKSWLLSRKVSVAGPMSRDGRFSLYLRDPDGVLIEITNLNAESVQEDYVQDLGRSLPGVREITEDMRLTTFDHASPLTTDPKLTAMFFEKMLGLKNIYVRENPDERNTAIVAIGNEEQPDFLRYLSSHNAKDGRVGTGSVHHIAMAVEDEEDQRRIMRRLDSAGQENSGIIDRVWFKSLYFHDPEGNLLEVATKGPGYTSDEPLGQLGTRLVLPPWLESRRLEIEAKLEELDRRTTKNWPPNYPNTRTPPERLTLSEG